METVDGLGPGAAEFVATVDEHVHHDQLRVDLNADQVRAILDSPARTRILILDCCHSGQAMVRLGRLGGGVSAVLNQVDIEGTHVLTASGPSQAARAPDGGEFTAFTDVLIQLMRGGINGGPELLTCGFLFPYLYQLLVRAGLPKPHQQTKDTAAQLALVRNAAFVDGAAPAVRLPSAAAAESVRADDVVSRSAYPYRCRSWRVIVMVVSSGARRGGSWP